MVHPHQEKKEIGLRAKFVNNHRVNTELSLDLKIDSVFWVSNEDIGIVFY